MDQLPNSEQRPRVGLFPLILTGLACGVFCGLFFGELTASLKLAGDVYVGLLRMCILPYIVVSLIASIAKLTVRQGRRLALKGSVVMTALWGLGLLAVVVFAAALPAWKAGAFYSTAVTETPRGIDFIKVFIPVNIFASLTEEAIPAVVVFCGAVGIALAGLPNKRTVIDYLDVVTRALTRVNHFIVKLTPVGVFVLSAHAAGTMSWAEIERLQAYFILYTAVVFLLTFIILPLLITSLTPFRHAQVVAMSRDALVTAFATGKLIVVLPLLIENTERLFAESDNSPSDEDDPAPAVDLLYPLAYSLPHLGKILAILFIPFAAWFLGDAMEPEEYPAFLGAGLVGSFGGPILAIPYLLDWMHLPRDMFQLFLLTGVLCGRLGDVLGTMHLVTFTILTTCAFRGQLSLHWRAIVRCGLATGASGILAVVATSGVLHLTLQYVDPHDERITHMQLHERPVASVVLDADTADITPLQADDSLLDRIMDRGVLRVGFNADSLPFAFFNGNGDLVGFDIDMAHLLARDLGVRIEFIPFARATLVEQLRDDDFDIAMSSLVGTLDKTLQLEHTHPYLHVSLALAVRDYRAREFRTREQVGQLGNVEFAYADVSDAFVSQLKERVPNIRFRKLRTNREFFSGGQTISDALLISAESGYAFTLLYPDFEVVVPTQPRISLPLVYAVGNRDASLSRVLEHWLDLKQHNGTIDQLYDYWILGKGQTDQQPRWCIVRDVLGWID